MYIGNLNPKITESDLKMVFTELGEVEKIELPKDPATNQGRGYAYLKYVLVTDFSARPRYRSYTVACIV